MQETPKKHITNKLAQFRKICTKTQKAHKKPKAKTTHLSSLVNIAHIQHRTVSSGNLISLSPTTITVHM